MFMDKVKNFYDHSMILLEMAGDLLAGGHFWPPPASFRVELHAVPSSDDKFSLIESMSTTFRLANGRQD